jgi:hypothetical protein
LFKGRWFIFTAKNEKNDGSPCIFGHPQASRNTHLASVRGHQLKVMRHGKHPMVLQQDGCGSSCKDAGWPIFIFFLRGCHFVKSAEASKEVNKNTIYDLNMGEG